MQYQIIHNYVVMRLQQFFHQLLLLKRHPQLQSKCYYIYFSFCSFLCSVVISFCSLVSNAIHIFLSYSFEGLLRNFRFLLMELSILLIVHLHCLYITNIHVCNFPFNLVVLAYLFFFFSSLN